MRKIKGFLLIVAAVLALAGCQSAEYYQEQAVIEAREFLLKKAPDLTLEEAAYVKYNRPVIVHENILGGVYEIKSDQITSDLSQIGVVWQIPGRKEMFMVWGVSSESLRFFRPERLIIREVKVANVNLNNAKENAKQLILNNLNKELSNEEYNYIRFAEPEIMITSFIFDENGESISDDLIQVSFIWKIRDGKFNAVAAGECKRDFEGFTVHATGIFSEEELQEYLVKNYDEFMNVVEENSENTETNQENTEVEEAK